MKRHLIGIGFGVVAGCIDVTPMILRRLTLDADLSAFSMWIVVGLILSSVNLQLHSVVKGIIVSFSVLLPVAILIAWKQPVSLIPISIMTLIIGGCLGLAIDKFASRG